MINTVVFFTLVSLVATAGNLQVSGHAQQISGTGFGSGGSSGFGSGTSSGFGSGTSSGFGNGESAGGGSIFMGFILGPLLFICSFVCIWYNEKRAAIDHRRLELASNICENVDAKSRNSIVGLNEKLVYVTGQSMTNQFIGDSISGINCPNAIKIIRLVEVQEWRVHRYEKNGNHYVQYTLNWVTTNSPNEGDRFNSPGNWWIKGDTIYNQNVNIGEYNMSKSISDLCTKSVPLPITMEEVNRIKASSGKNVVASMSDGYAFFSPVSGQAQGTMRVSYSMCPTGPITVVGKSQKNQIVEFNLAEYQGDTSNHEVPNCCCCLISSCYAELLKPIEKLLQVHEENISRDEAFNKAVQKSKSFTLWMRIGAYIVMVLSICLFFNPITTILGYIPLIGGLISGIVGFVILLAALLICIPLYVLALAISWLFFHPKVGIALLVIGLATAGTIIFLTTRNSAAIASQEITAHALLSFRDV